MPILEKLGIKDTKAKAVKDLIKQSRPDNDFFYMTILAVLMATFGLLLNNATVIIGSMLIAPLLWPILSLALGIVMADMSLILRSLLTIAKALGLSIVAATVITLFISSPEAGLTMEILSRTEPSLTYAGIAIVAGLAAAYAMINPDVNESLPGVAIAVALIPPVAVIGIGIAKLDWSIISQSFILFLINILGIIFASIITFSISNLYAKRAVAHEEIAKEDKELNNHD